MRDRKTDIAVCLIADEICVGIGMFDCSTCACAHVHGEEINSR